MIEEIRYLNGIKSVVVQITRRRWLCQLLFSLSLSYSTRARGSVMYVKYTVHSVHAFYTHAHEHRLSLCQNFRSRMERRCENAYNFICENKDIETSIIDICMSNNEK